MARIAGIDIPRDKKVPYSLRYIYGIGLTTAKEICDKAKIDHNKRVKDLTEKKVVTIRDFISKIELAICLVKKNPMENILQKATELGVYKITPIVSDRTEV